jgi:hypothetical protein
MQAPRYPVLGFRRPHLKGTGMSALPVSLTVLVCLFGATSIGMAAARRSHLKISAELSAPAQKAD